ncbi:MAG: YwaF family protein [Streptococcus hyovaginalis]|nr:YwaF family protein [Streptococcus hyovaginalis]MDY5974424.1 YwaF family protein [Streptococcus hyovaginalis]
MLVLSALVMLFLPESKLKTYFAYLGTAGAICALTYPIFDPYPFLHVTILSYVIGYFALLINSLIYLYGSKEKRDLPVTEVVKISLLMNLFIAMVNAPLNANYG